MADDENSAPLLLDVTRQIWRRWEGVRPTGIDRICDAWLEHFAPRSQAVIITKRRQVILPLSASRALFSALLPPISEKDAIGIFRRKIIAIALRWAAHLLRNLDGKGRLWLNAGHTGLHNPELVGWCATADVRPVYLIHDLIPITHPQYCRPGEDAKHIARVLTVLRTGEAVVANSQHTLDVLLEFANGVGLAVPCAGVAWPGCGNSIGKAGGAISRHEPADFIILGTIEARKNHALLLSVWKRLMAEMGDACPRLVIVGRRGWEAEEVFSTLDHHDFDGKVIEAGAMDDQQLSDLLGRARALLFPSHTEGFGIPLVEALAAGIPVIASDLTVFREIAGDIPELLPANNESAWVNVIKEYSSRTSARRERQLSRIKDYTVPTWAEHFERVEALLDKLKLDDDKRIR